MTRREFLMKISAGLTTAIVLPSIPNSLLFSPNAKQIEFFETPGRYVFFSTPFGRSNWVKDMYGIRSLHYVYPKKIGMITNIKLEE